MRISAVVADLAADLESLGGLGDETMAETARRLASAMQGPMAARLVEVLGQAAAELDANVPDGRVEVRLVGDDAVLVLVTGQPDAHDETAPDAEADARITLRLPSALKVRVEAASARDGVSVNTWIVRALTQQAAGTQRAPKVGRRLTGYGRS